MKIPTLAGIIKRRILVNFRADPDTVQRLLPAGFRPKLHRGKAVAGICLIRLEHIRPKMAPEFLGLNSENAAHRIAVEWDEDGETREGVFIPRRDTDSALNSIAGGTLFPGEQNRANFTVIETDNGIDLVMESQDHKVRVDLNATFAEELPKESIFMNLDDSSEFFRGGGLGYSVTRGAKHLDGMTLEINDWKVRPLEVESVTSSFYGDTDVFPEGTIEFDHALIMQNVEHEWHAAPDYSLSL
ncbi:MAG TPA: DUF2071 domain-containing protein [Pyrinomonadaceae bacterium]|nr:DUF2071 domain-containing protein [Pyrinomonadaceae bacterium]HMP65841.1 DUF2071 domain-containing protein [Pyrinomonadaceae bacterium]